VPRERIKNLHGRYRRFQHTGGLILDDARQGIRVGGIEPREKYVGVLGCLIVRVMFLSDIEHPLEKIFTHVATLPPVRKDVTQPNAPAPGITCRIAAYAGATVEHKSPYPTLICSPVRRYPTKLSTSC